ncbi:L,D-transpeptidase family protein [Histidinibacterium aquaticum]|uniref:L,D-transpeptidase family protein n=1 Tax=Histidinibacterium aquaticum TaxID=2613962 RepID=A0A5J5GFN8_9RHOB|nr:L,D-transpeptidase family protein [Histidinibacterium aquaticum]KAA9006897.1 L,D-transpeptidase family protein [Histidinibacterium aquaticum]
MRVRIFVLLAVLVGLAACAPPSKFLTYNGPAVTQVLLFKEQRRLYLMHHDQTLESYEFELGFAPTGHKTFEGDGRTPEGHYFIDRRNPNSEYHLSVGISYPDAEDVARALEMELEPGGDIFIHGTPSLFADRDDWTAGCIAVSNEAIEKIYAMVPNGTPITIYP